MRLPLILLLFAIICSCSEQSSFSDPSEYFGFLNSPSNGLVMEREVNGVRFKARYLPPDYQAYIELSRKGNFSPEERDSLIKYYSNSITFLLTASPTEETGKKNDIMYRGVNSYQEYHERAFQMNFGVENMVELLVDSVSYAPVLTNLENVYGLTEGRNILLVFAAGTGNEQVKNSRKLDLVFTDALFDTGINHFVFDSKKIRQVPGLKF